MSAAEGKRGPSRSTISRRRKRAGLIKIWLPRDAVEDLLLDGAAIGEWDVDDPQKVQHALLKYLMQKKADF